MKQTLDRLLRAWASRQAPDPSRLEELRRRISRQIGEDRFLALDSGASADAEAPFWRKWIHAGLGAAAALMISSAIFFLFKSPPAPQASQSPAELAAIPGPQLEARATLFREIETLFPDAVHWVVISNEDVDMKIASEANTHSQRIVLRILIAVREEGGNAWRTLWEADVLTYAEELVQASVGTDGENALRVWVYPVDQNRVAVDSHLELNAPIRLSSFSTDLLELGKPAQVMLLKSSGTEYRVFQTVRRLPDTGV